MTAPFFFPEDSTVSESLVPPDVLKRLRQRSLFDTGIGILGAAGESGATFGGSLAQGLQFGRQAYGEGLDRAQKNAIVGRKAEEEDRLKTVRSGLRQKYASVPGETSPQRIERLTRAAQEYAEYGDTETAGKLVQVANALRLTTAGASSPYTYLQKNGRIYKIEKATGAVSVINDDGSLEARQELAEARLALQEQGLSLRESNLDISKQRLGLAERAAERPAQDERKTRLQYETALGALPILDVAPAVGRLNWLGDRFGVGEVVSGEQQRINAAGAAFMNAWVRENSGAATSKEDWEVIARGYLPQPGDKPENLRFKKYQRDLFMRSLREKMARAATDSLPSFEPGSGIRPGTVDDLDNF